MHIVIAHHTRLPVFTYGGTERIMWWLGKVLVNEGHRVTYLINQGSQCPFAEVKPINNKKPLNDQIPESADLVHFFFQPRESIDKPFLVTNQGNVPDEDKQLLLAQNTVFVSRDHAARHGASCFVYNGIDPTDYEGPSLGTERSYFHFLGKASWKVKNLKGAIDIATESGHRLEVIGGSRWNFKMGFRFTSNRNVKFHGMIGGKAKDRILNHSKGLIFPVLWNEPFGIAMIESLYFGCPVFGTQIGSLPEVVSPEVGYLSNSKSDLIKAMSELSFSPQICHEYILENFTSDKMMKAYLSLYDRVLNGEPLNERAPTAIRTVNEKVPNALQP